MKSVKQQVLKRPASSGVAAAVSAKDVATLVNSLSAADCKKLLVNAARKDPSVLQNIQAVAGEGPPKVGRSLSTFAGGVIRMDGFASYYRALPFQKLAVQHEMLERMFDDMPSLLQVWYGGQCGGPAAWHKSGLDKLSGCAREEFPQHLLDKWLVLLRSHREDLGLTSAQWAHLSHKAEKECGWFFEGSVKLKGGGTATCATLVPSAYCGDESRGPWERATQEFLNICKQE